MLGLILLSFAAGDLSQSVCAQADAEVIRQVNSLASKSWEQRAEILRGLADNHRELTLPPVENRLVGLLASESRRADWEENSESESYQSYYGFLLQAVTGIAKANTGRIADRAWHVLALANYNDDSSFALSLAGAAGAQRVLRRIVADRSLPAGSRARALYVIAESCQLSKDNCAEARQIVLGQRGVKNEWISLAVVRALALCGKRSDLALLRRLKSQSADKYFRQFVDSAERQILRRES